ncbi:PA2779 family protein [Paraglaciecola aestuariivivens]
MKYLKTVCVAACLTLGFGQIASAGVYSSEQVIQAQQFKLSKQQVLGLLSEGQVQEKLVALGVSQEQAEKRINAMTPSELAELNQQLTNAPAGGIVGTVVTVLVVVAVLDLMGLTDVYPFIRPIGG